MKKILIANRGEIAIRIARTVRDLGYLPITLFSTADEKAVHVRFGHEAYRLTGETLADTYLNIEKIISIAKSAGAVAIHPGYGFLSENAAFSESCQKAGLIFIGPSPACIRDMGDKIRARELAEKAGVPTLSGGEPVLSAKDAHAQAARIGYPILLKAKAGGGGKGMRKVDAESQLDEAFRLAQSEAEKSFKDGSLYIEKYLEHARHVEVQVFADDFGQVFAIGDRDCSIQRRHQKVIEEAPAPGLKDATRKAMAAAAISLTKSVNYRGAGTLEFLVDAQEGFYFLEMNTRLQVEHPVSEWISSQDFVALQIKVAFGEKLAVDSQKLSGHSLEVRLYAEDPDNGFFPMPGKLTHVAWPTGPFTRVDTGVESGSEITLFYDPMIAKVSVWAETRELAVKRMIRALKETKIVGTKTNIGFLINLMSHPKFTTQHLTTQFISNYGPFSSPTISAVALSAGMAVIKDEVKPDVLVPDTSTLSPWWTSGLKK